MHESTSMLLNVGDHLRRISPSTIGQPALLRRVSLRGIKPDALDLDLYTQAGRNAMLKLSADW